MYNYDEVYAVLSENNIEKLFTDLENDQLLGEDAFLLDSLMHKREVNIVPKKEKIQQIQYGYGILKI